MLNDGGINYKSSMLFTYDPKMAKEQKDADRGKRVRSEFEEASKKYDITEDCIIYGKSKENYFAEFSEVSYMMDLKHLRGKGFKALSYLTN